MNQKKLQQQLISQANQSYPLEKNNTSTKRYDVFISHAWEDKDDFVRPLAKRLSEENIEVWYDEISIQWGTSIRQSIDKGLANSKFGLVVISNTFLSKYSTNYEIDGIFQKEARDGGQYLLPIWHHVSKDEILGKSPSLADRHALNSSTHSIEDIVNEVKNRIEPTENW